MKIELELAAVLMVKAGILEVHGDNFKLTKEYDAYLAGEMNNHDDLIAFNDYLTATCRPDNTFEMDRWLMHKFAGDAIPEDRLDDCAELLHHLLRQSGAERITEQAHLRKKYTTGGGHSWIT